MLGVMKMDPELNPLCPDLENINIHLNTTGQVDHITYEERLIRTTKDITRAILDGTPLKRLPEMLTVGLILSNMLWGNAIDAKEGMSSKMIPDAIIKFRKIIHKKHFYLAFVGYAKTHKEGDNTITRERNLGDIVLLFIGNYQGAHIFLSLNTGTVTNHTNWKIIPIPSHAIKRVNDIIHREPIVLDFRDWNIQDILHEEHANDNGYYETYVPSGADSDYDMIFEDDSEIEDNTPETGVNN